MKFSEFPPEIKLKVKQKVEEQDNVYLEANFDTHISRDRLDDGFTWHRTEEGAEFWRRVLLDENFEVFFKRYPKNFCVPPYTSTNYPSDAKVGSKWRVIDNYQLEHGEIVTLCENDGTYRPFFTTLNYSSRCLNWGILTPYEEEVIEEVKGFIPPTTKIKNQLYHDVFRSNFPEPRCTESIKGQVYQQINVPQVRSGH